MEKEIKIEKKEKSKFEIELEKLENKQKELELENKKLKLEKLEKENISLKTNNEKDIIIPNKKEPLNKNTFNKKEFDDNLEIFMNKNGLTKNKK